ncbi:hypothetical protein AKJ09_00531 [Labilithrix luteola]|uniref:Uncharacterized protein n=1 Tax=Labilithrix luteola TaxID=1391654 RepID=A0A0K1PK25_9BACT|nr:hypothetical protein AKJ09_00531 [Labilithrix luteola]
MKPGLRGCLSESAFRKEILRRLPDDPFADDGAIVITTVISAQGERLRAHIELHDPNEPDAVDQEVFARPDECATLGAAAALAVSLTIQHSRELARTREAPPDESNPTVPHPSELVPEEPSSTPQVPPGPSPVRPIRNVGGAARRPTKLELRTHAVLALGWGLLPDVTPGTLFGASLKRGHWSATLEAGGFLPARSESSRGGGANAWLVFLAAAGCGHLGDAGRLFACGTVTVGDFRAAGTTPLLSRSSESTYVAVGARVGLELPISRPFALVVQLDGTAPVVRQALRIGDELLWKTPVVGGYLSVGVRMSIL